MRRKNVRVSLLSYVACVLVIPSVAMADGIDVTWLLTRVGGWNRKPLLAFALCIGPMFFNYLLNVAVIGVPAAKAGERGRLSFCGDLVWYTLLAQIVDRVGCILGVIIAAALATVFGANFERQILWGFLGGYGLNFLFSGLGVAILSGLLMRKRWSIPRIQFGELQYAQASSRIQLG